MQHCIKSDFQTVVQFKFKSSTIQQIYKQPFHCWYEAKNKGGCQNILWPSVQVATLTPAQKISHSF